MLGARAVSRLRRRRIATPCVKFVGWLALVLELWAPPTQQVVIHLWDSELVDANAASTGANSRRVVSQSKSSVKGNHSCPETRNIDQTQNVQVIVAPTCRKVQYDIRNS
eukprot:5459652-Amphidinium_carterae.1